MVIQATFIKVLDGSKTAIEHRQYNVQIAQNVRDKASEGISHDNLGKAYLKAY